MLDSMLRNPNPKSTACRVPSASTIATCLGRPNFMSRAFLWAIWSPSLAGLVESELSSMVHMLPHAAADAGGEPRTNFPRAIQFLLFSTLGLQGCKEHLRWGVKCISRTYFGVFWDQG